MLTGSPPKNPLLLDGVKLLRRSATNCLDRLERLWVVASAWSMLVIATVSACSKVTPCSLSNSCLYEAGSEGSPAAV